MQLILDIYNMGSHFLIDIGTASSWLTQISFLGISWISLFSFTGLFIFIGVAITKWLIS